jgi:hypothetical protein
MALRLERVARRGGSRVAVLAVLDQARAAAAEDGSARVVLFATVVSAFERVSAALEAGDRDGLREAIGVLDATLELFRAGGSVR